MTQISPQADKNFTNIIAINPTCSINASGQMTNMVFEINQANQIMEQIAKTAQSDAVKGGFAAETWHTETFNLDAILKDKSVRAFTDNYKNSPLVKLHLKTKKLVQRSLKLPKMLPTKPLTKSKWMA